MSNTLGSVPRGEQWWQSAMGHPGHLAVLAAGVQTVCSSGPDGP
jgi:hypothetical protein